MRPPNRPSRSAQTIRQLLGKSARLSRTTAIPLQYDTVINWGNTDAITTRRNVQILNRPDKVRVSVNKLEALQRLQEAGVPVPDFSTSKPKLKKGDIWFARTVLRGSGGEGIKVIRPKDTIPEAPLYVKYVKKSREFRVHVVNGQAIFSQEKKRERDFSQSEDQKLIRNRDNGWVFCLVHEEPPAGVKDAAVACVAGLGLDFGAVDIVLDRATGKPYVLELNSAPGLESPTLIEAYKEAFTKWLVPATQRT